ncbi:hypothetical protein AB7M34_007295, partial [Methylobacterium radiotolerans]
MIEKRIVLTPTHTTLREDCTRTSVEDLLEVGDDDEVVARLDDRADVLGPPRR